MSASRSVRTSALHTLALLLFLLIGSQAGAGEFEVHIPPRLGFPLVTESRVYVGSQAGPFYCFEKDTGRLIWRYDASAPTYNRPVLHNGVIYLGGQDGFLRAFEAESGEQLWSFECGRVEWPIRDRFVNGEVTIQGSVAYFSSEDWNVYAVELASGREVWRLRLGEEPQALQLPINGGVGYIGSWDGYLYAIDAAEGKMLWHSTTDSDHIGKTLRDGHGELYFKPDTLGGETLSKQAPYVTTVPLVIEDWVYFSDWSGNLMAVDRESGRQRWRFKPETLNSRHVGSRFHIVHHDGVIYYATQEDGHLYGVDRLTGRELWKYESENAVFGPLAGEGAVMLFIDVPMVDGQMHGFFLTAMDLESKKILWTKQDNCALPFVRDGVVYYGSFSGTVLGVDIRTGEQVYKLGK